MLFGIDLKILVSGLILLTACVDDLRSRKIHNNLILFLFPLALLSMVLLGGVEALKTGLVSALLALAMGLPLTLFRMMGGGDFKLLVVFAITLHWLDFLKVFIYSLPWALLLGLLKIILDKKLKEFLWNVVFLFRHRSTQGLQFHTIPFSIVLFAAWLSFLSLQGTGLFDFR